MLLEAFDTNEVATTFEAHGTGTTLGDPIEVGSIVRVLLEGRSQTEVHCASIKGNTGHLEAAAAGGGVSILFATS